MIEGITPQVDCGRFPAKRTIGETATVEADVFTDGHDRVAARLRYRGPSDADWTERAMEPLGNDRFAITFPLTEVGRYRFTVSGWVDRFGTWRGDLEKRVDAGQDVKVDLAIGAALVRAAASAAPTKAAANLEKLAARLETGDAAALKLALGDELRQRMEETPDRSWEALYDGELEIHVDRERARFSSWYELFPRSCAPTRGAHGTFADVEKRLPYVQSMGFDVLYLPPIHPIGTTNRKGPNNSVVARKGDPGSPWAIGASDGGHTDIHSELGTLKDFQKLLKAAAGRGLELAMDLAYQCTPDHPWVSEHPEWFRARPDGTIQYAENPPKKYQDIYPIDFESSDWKNLWDGLKGVVDFWIDHGVRIFRVDNPHTKAFAFWEWMIAEVMREHPDVIFLAEAFTRPKVMYRLAKIGFTQSYTYFSWRNEKWEIEEYATEVSKPPVSDFFRPNFWPNTPDILTEHLQRGGRGAFVSRLVLAGTLSANYGIYGPAFELQEHLPVKEGSEEYRDSEKYQVRAWDLDRPASLSDLVARVNLARRAHPALQFNESLQFLPSTNDAITAYLKTHGDDAVLTIVNVDPHWAQSGYVDVPLEQLGLDPHRSFVVHDLLGGAEYVWSGERNYVELDPAILPAHILHLRGHPDSGDAGNDEGFDNRT